MRAATSPPPPPTNTPRFCYRIGKDGITLFIHGFSISYLEDYHYQLSIYLNRIMKVKNNKPKLNNKCCFSWRPCLKILLITVASQFSLTLGVSSMFCYFVIVELRIIMNK